jgi:hypothetical protein
VIDEKRWLSPPGKRLENYLRAEDFVGLELCYCKVKGDDEWNRLMKRGYFGTGFCPRASEVFEAVNPDIVILLGETVAGTLGLSWKE